jgi:hypothetical protein
MRRSSSRRRGALQLERNDGPNWISAISKITIIAAMASILRIVVVLLLPKVAAYSVGTKQFNAVPLGSPGA